VFLQVLGDDEHCLFNTRLLRVDVNLCLLWCLVRGTDAGELLDLTRSRLLVQTLGIALLSLLDGNVNENLDEWQRRVDVLGVGVEITGELTVGLVGRDKGGQGDGGRVGEELGDLGGISIGLRKRVSR
jgi:hypothetical protein